MPTFLYYVKASSLLNVVSLQAGYFTVAAPILQLSIYPIGYERH